MKKIEEYEVGDYVRPLMDGWNCDGGGGRLYTSQEYVVKQFFRDEGGRKAPYSWVRIADGADTWFCVNFGRLMLSRLEIPPSLSDLAALPNEVWLSADGVFREDGVNRQTFMLMLREAKAQGLHVPRKVDTRPKNQDRIYKLLNVEIAMVSVLKPQARTLLRIMMDLKKPGGFSERELNDILLKSHDDLRTRQDPWKVFNYYKKDFVSSGILEITEPED